MSDVPYYRFYVGDYQRDTAHLTMLEHGAYRPLLDHYMATRYPLPDDPAKLYRICRARTPSERKAVLSVAAEFFIKDGTLLRHKRCDSEIANQLKYSQSQSANAQRRHSHRNATAQPRQDGGDIRREQHDFESKICRSDSNNQLDIIDSSPAVAMPRARVITSIPSSNEEGPDGQKIDPKGRLFNLGLKYLIQHGSKDGAARSFIGSLCKEYRNDYEAILQAFTAAEAEGVAEPKSWISAYLKRSHCSPAYAIGDMMN